MKWLDYEFKKALSLKVAGWLPSEGKPNHRKKSSQGWYKTNLLIEVIFELPMTANGTLADCNVTIITIHLLNGNSKRNNSMSHSKDKLYLKLFSDEWETILGHLKSFYLSPNGTNCVSSITFQRSAINWRWTAPIEWPRVDFAAKRFFCRFSGRTKKQLSAETSGSSSSKGGDSGHKSFTRLSSTSPLCADFIEWLS